VARSLIEAFGVGRDVVAVVGAGGKSTLVFGLAAELRGAGRTVVATTTTKMGADQDGGLPVVGQDEDAVRAALERSGACLAVGSVDGHKAVGVASEWIDVIASRRVADVIVIEADGARRKLVKAPAGFEPVIPGSSTLVVAVMSLGAIGEPIAEVAHRPELLARLVGADLREVFTVDHAAALLTSRAGARKGVPEHARFMVALTGEPGAGDSAAGELARAIEPIPVVILPEADGPELTATGR
jgi:probable selenium-dependent hydroxylase accessory protein YqeC